MCYIFFLSVSLGTKRHYCFKLMQTQYQGQSLGKDHFYKAYRSIIEETETVKSNSIEQGSLDLKQ